MVIGRPLVLESVASGSDECSWKDILYGVPWHRFRGSISSGAVGTKPGDVQPAHVPVQTGVADLSCAFPDEGCNILCFLFLYCGRTRVFRLASCILLGWNMMGPVEHSIEQLRLRAGYIVVDMRTTFP